MEFANNIYSWLTKENGSNCIKQLSDNQILNIASDINAIFSETNLVDSKPELSLPRLVVVGTQSSGKSSVLNAIMAMDLLPTGKNMVTRTPLDIRLHKLTNGKNSDGWIEFGYYDGAAWITDTKLTLTVPSPTIEEITQVRKVISKKTVDVAGEGMNISFTPIVIKIYSPYVPNLSLIDLPGLTMVACTDKGQPEDIKDRIENLVNSYIKQPRTIILAVMQARSDLETDLGLALIKKYDSQGQRTIGVLTKPDLMNFETHVGEYLTNSISKNLMLSYGYYVVRNRSDKESQDADILKGFEIEKNYFMNHYEYKKQLYKDRIGTLNLTRDLSKILISSIQELIPSVMTEMLNLESKVNKKLDRMGESLPQTKEGKLSIMNRFVTNYFYKFVDSIESRGTILNTGKQIKDVFIGFRNDLHDIHPFKNNQIYSDSYFKDVISSFEGNHMSFNIPPIQVLEACMIDDKHKPMLLLQEPSLRCVDTVCENLVQLIRQIAQQEEFSQFPPLSNHIVSVFVEDIIAPLKMKAKQMIIDIIKFQEDYIWTDSKEFFNSLTQLTKSGKFDHNSIIQLMESYYSAVKDIIADTVPKIIMSKIVREMERNIQPILFQKVVSEEKIGLLREDESVEKQRTYYTDLKNRIDGIKRTFSKSNV